MALRYPVAVLFWLNLAGPAGAQQVWDGPPLVFSKPAFADIDLAENQDRLTDGVWLTRDDTRGLFNIRLQPGFTAGAPADTRWAFAGLLGNPADVSAARFDQLAFSDWANALGGPGQLSGNIVDRPGVLHMITEDVYVDIVFTAWGVGAAGGGAFTYRRSTAGRPPLRLGAGLNLYAPTAELGDGVDSCFDLLTTLGGESVVFSIARLDPLGQVMQRCRFQAGLPAGDDFATQLGEAYLVDLLVARDVATGPAGGCPPTDLAAGVNLVGVAVPTADLRCRDLLAAFGAGVVGTVERLGPDLRFEACATRQGQAPSAHARHRAVGVDFPVVVGEGYLVHGCMHRSSGPAST